MVATLLLAALAHDYYVSSSSGSDAAAGDAAHPWRSLARISNATLGAGDAVHLAAGDVWNEPLVLRAAASCESSTMHGVFEAVKVTPLYVTVSGWVVDTELAGGGVPAVPVKITLNGTVVANVVANVTRPDLPAAGVAPSAEHGLKVNLSSSVVAALQHGAHRLAVVASSTACGRDGWALRPGKSPVCVCDGRPCACTSASVAVLATPGATVQRPTIRLGGAGAAVTVSGFDAVSIAGLEMAHAALGVVALGTHGGGDVAVRDCVFRGVWNRSSIGQTILVPGRDCSNGWTQSVAVSGFGRATVANNLFDDVDVAIQEFGALGEIDVLDNTITRANGNTIMMTGTVEWRIRGNVFSRDDAPRFFQCGTTDIMIGGAGTRGSIDHNEIGWRGEHPASPDGCAIDYEGGSAGVAVTDNVIHDSYAAGVMVFGESDVTHNISNATIARNLFVRNGAVQTSADHGSLSFMERGSTGTCTDNTFYASDPDESFVFHEQHAGTLAAGWTLANNTVRPVSALPAAIADTPAVKRLVYLPNGTANVTIMSRHNPARPTTALWTVDGSWPRAGQPGTRAAPLVNWIGTWVLVPRTAALNVRFAVDGLLPSLTMTMVVLVPPPVDDA